MHFINRAMPIDDIDGKSHKAELKAAESIQSIIQSQNLATSYLCLGDVHTSMHTRTCTPTHTHTHTHTRTHTQETNMMSPAQKDFKKLGVRRPV